MRALQIQLKDLNHLIIYKEYAARESKSEGLSAKELYLEIKKANDTAAYCDNEKELIKHLKTDRTIAFVGAGNIYLVAEKLLENNC